MHQLAVTRKRLGYSQTQLGYAIGYEQGAVSKMETGKMPIKLETLQLAADFLGVDLKNLIGDDGNGVIESGFRECAVSEWRPRAQRAGAKTNAIPFDPAVLAPDAKHPASYLIDHSKGVPFGFQQGTVVVIDLARVAGEGELGLANMVDPNTGIARTILGRILGHYLVGPNFANDQNDRTTIEADRIGAIHPIVAWFNAPDLAGT